MDRQLEPRRSRGPVLVGAVCLLAGVVTLGLGRARSTLPVVTRQEVSLETVRRETLVETVSGPGRLVPVHVRWLTATHRARIEQELVHPGDLVQPHTVVAMLANPEVNLALLEAEQKLAAARIQVAATQRQLTSEAHALQLDLATVREQARLAEENLSRSSSLQIEGVTSVADSERAMSQQRELGERLRLLEAHAVQQAREQSAELAPGYALVAALEQIVRHQRQELLGLTLSSGARGVVNSVAMEPGQWVEAGVLLAKVIVSPELQAELLIDELQARDVAVGQPATITLGSARLLGSVSQVEPVASRGTVTVQVTLAEPEAGFRADQRVSGEIEVRRHAAALSVRAPVQATHAGHYTLYRLVGADALVATETELVPATVDRVLVQSGLGEGDQIVVSDMERFDGLERLSLH